MKLNKEEIGIILSGLYYEIKRTEKDLLEVPPRLSDKKVPENKLTDREYSLKYYCKRVKTLYALQTKLEQQWK